MNFVIKTGWFLEISGLHLTLAYKLPSGMIVGTGSPEGKR